MQMDRWTERRDDVNSSFSQFCEWAYKQFIGLVSVSKGLNNVNDNLVPAYRLNKFPEADYFFVFR